MLFRSDYRTLSPVGRLTVVAIATALRNEGLRTETRTSNGLCGRVIHNKIACIRLAISRSPHPRVPHPDASHHFTLLT